MTIQDKLGTGFGSALKVLGKSGLAVAAASGAVVLIGGAIAIPVLGSGGDSKHSTKVRAAGHGWTVRADAAAHKKKGLKFVYVRGYKTVQPGQFFGASMRCPLRYPHPISSFFDSGSEKLVLTSDLPDPANASPRRVRKWFIGVTNFDTQPANVQVGVACIK